MERKLGQESSHENLIEREKQSIIRLFRNEYSEESLFQIESLMGRLRDLQKFRIEKETERTELLIVVEMFLDNVINLFETKSFLALDSLSIQYIVYFLNVAIKIISESRDTLDSNQIEAINRKILESQSVMNIIGRFEAITDYTEMYLGKDSIHARISSVQSRREAIETEMVKMQDEKATLSLEFERYKMEEEELRQEDDVNMYMGLEGKLGATIVDVPSKYKRAGFEDLMDIGEELLGLVSPTSDLPYAEELRKLKFLGEIRTIDDLLLYNLICKDKGLHLMISEIIKDNKFDAPANQFRVGKLNKIVQERLSGIPQIKARVLSIAGKYVGDAKGKIRSLGSLLVDIISDEKHSLTTSHDLYKQSLTEMSRGIEVLKTNLLHLVEEREDIITHLISENRLLSEGKYLSQRSLSELGLIHDDKINVRKFLYTLKTILCSVDRVKRYEEILHPISDSLLYLSDSTPPKSWYNFKGEQSTEGDPRDFKEIHSRSIDDGGIGEKTAFHLNTDGIPFAHMYIAYEMDLDVA